MAVMDKQGDGVIYSSLQSLLGLQHTARVLGLGKNRIRARNIGQHLSMFKGRGMDFAESRPYQPGDDVRTLDWRVTARTGKAHTKVFQEERERPILIWVDMRSSMFFATKQAFKSVIAAQIAALLAWKGRDDGDRVGGMIVTDTRHVEVKPSRTKSGIVRFLQKVSGYSQQGIQSELSEGKADGRQRDTLAEAWKRLRRVVDTGSRVYLISDFRGVDEQALKQISHMQQHAEVTLISVTDPLEHSLPTEGELNLTHGQRYLRLNLKRRSWVNNYQKKALSQQNKLQRFAHKYRIGWISLSTQDSDRYRLRKIMGLSR